MKLVTFTQATGTHLGVLVDRDGSAGIADLYLLDPSLPADMAGFLAAGKDARDKAQEVLSPLHDSGFIPLKDVHLKAPVLLPGKIICVGINYRDHSTELQIPAAPYPTFFSKYNNCIIGPNEPIVIPRVATQVDWEGELGVVIGKRGKYIPEEKALDYVGGYAIFNDVSERDFQFRTSQWMIGKTFDTFGPMGPALVTAEEIRDPANLGIRTWVNGELMQNSNTKYLIFNIPQLISYLSQVMTLDPGDLISTGTPAGVAMHRDPKRFLKPGDVVRIEIESIGYLENPVIAER